MAASNLAGPIGLPLDRVDGRLKVTGGATYAFEYAAQGGAAYGVIVPATIGKGRVIALDVRHAQHAPGVQLVLTKDNAPPQTPWGPVDLPDRFARAEPALDTDEVRYFGFPVAFVVADTVKSTSREAIRPGTPPGVPCAATDSCSGRTPATSLSPRLSPSGAVIWKPPAAVRWPFVTSTSIRFIGGLPMKRAANSVAGRS